MKKLKSAEETKGRGAICAYAEEAGQEKQADHGKKQTTRGAELCNDTTARSVKVTSHLLR